ncbi:MAG: PilZ domain-containing protein [Thermodesulfobacteriota bacterium]
MPIPESGPDVQERRSHPRITLKAFGFKHVSTFVRSGRRHQANLVDVSPGGARLALLDDRPPIAVNDTLVVDLGFACSHEDLSAIPGKVRWAGNSDFGVSFDKELSLVSSDLQQLLS